MAGIHYLGNMSFPTPKELAIQKENFDELCYKLHAYMNLYNPRYAASFKNVDENPHTMIKGDDLHEVQQARAEDGQLSQLLITDTKLAHTASLL